MSKKYNDMTEEEIENEVSSLRTALFNLRVENTTKALENTARIRETRRELARVMTSRRARQLAQAE